MAILYFSTPANDLPLPSFLGKENSSAHHIKHGIAVFLVGLALFAFAWFKTGPRRPATSN